ncbi:MAG: hypothetical protein ABEJ87_04375 [Candidatus Nanohalobium sp.]
MKEKRPWSNQLEIEEQTLRRLSSVYRGLIALIFSVGFALAFTSLIDPSLPINIISFFFPDEPNEIAGLLRISPQILLILYGTLTVFIAFLMYLLENYISLSTPPKKLLNSSLTLRLITIISFTTTFIAVRAIVAISGVVGPGTTGSAGGLPVIQIALPGFRVHHYIFGVLILIYTTYRMLFHENYSEKLMATLYGVGLGLFIDEIGLILSQGKYFTLSTYIFATLFATLFLTGLYIDIKTHRKQETA